MKKLLCVVGSTATGKTDLALSLAKKIKGELVACDSRQVYKGLDLGTGKEPGEFQSLSKKKGFWIVDDIKIWLYDVASPDKQYSVSDYIKDASSKVRQISAEYKLPIIVGGTGFYLDGLLNGVETDQIPADTVLREELEKLGLSDIQEKLNQLDPDFFESLNDSERQNSRRLIRKIEIITFLQNEDVKKVPPNGLAKDFEVLKIGLTVQKNILDERINQRVEKRVEEGMIEEAVRLHKEGLSYKRMRTLGLEYRVMADFLEGVIKTENEFIFVLQQKIRQFSKRQMTWFKRDKEIVWFDISDKEWQQKVVMKVGNWYNQ